MSHEWVHGPDSPYRVPHDDGFTLKDFSTVPPSDAPDKSERQQRLVSFVEEIDALQRVLYADNRHAVLLVFQAMDAAGKDGTIRAVLSGVDPAGCQVTSFKRPSENELDHDFLWRHARSLPERGRIGVFNRSWYEEVLAVRVHPEFLERQRLPWQPDSLDALWQERYESINGFERHLARNGTLILKFWLNVSREEQRERLLERLKEPDKNWKFDINDMGERARWDDFQVAYHHMLKETSKPWAPWYAIPADSKSYMRCAVAEIIAQGLRRLDLKYPDASPEVRQKLRELIGELRAKKGD
ncbi:polyphosphate kinase 2 family protein [Sinimarinibacterium sp. CAU 1509]|uniref:PPK2 family polyphosphate kinase n=1 Tax=Sinimarinibacterium sp. CAU 1509 TaxID=2562283 RepID=UPI0010AD1F56|nr:PPK2 family polyphosphate kinase [Sinimarinibacterium sp. CAU 1509]TJY58357.1 polyphosphate kinase 2 family protein [Sinimarinibacterium sp. CAU 1509]